ncbi:MAG: hypothetical protein JW892_06130 [Anaerolineae bacterium]|nr:hypothetical protein [Anaerolineae bacterium]
MKWPILILSLLVLLSIVACSTTPIPTPVGLTPVHPIVTAEVVETPAIEPSPIPRPTATQPSVFGEPDLRCGDGICGGPENPQNCPADCSSASSPAVLYLGIMVHLEGWSDQFNQVKFERHAQLMREYASLFETYGAKLTWESKELTDGVLAWGDNILLEMEQRGHGVGVHADIGGQQSEACAPNTARLRAEKQQLESLGVTVRHVSGIVSHCDWVVSAADAGYLFTTGTVAYAVMSLPLEDRPLEYRDCPSPAACHDTFPPDLEDRLHPWRASSGADWLTHDPDGRLVILPSSGGLSCMAEEALDQVCGEFTAEDIDAFLQEFDRAVALSQPGQVNTYYVAWSLGGVLDPTLLETWLQAISPYVASGQVEWKTLPEMYDAYVSWEQNY